MACEKHEKKWWYEWEPWACWWHAVVWVTIIMTMMCLTFWRRAIMSYIERENNVKPCENISVKMKEKSMLSWGTSVSCQYLIIIFYNGNMLVVVVGGENSKYAVCGMWQEKRQKKRKESEKKSQAQICMIFYSSSLTLCDVCVSNVSWQTCLYNMLSFLFVYVARNQ